MEKREHGEAYPDAVMCAFREGLVVFLAGEPGQRAANLVTHTAAGR